MRTYIFSIFFLLTLVFFGCADAQEKHKPLNSKEKVVCIYPMEIQAEFPGGEDSLMEFIDKKFIYPAIQGDVEGIVYIGFVIDSLGNVSKAKILRSLHPLYDKEALRVVNMMPRWKPTIRNGKNVSNEWILPIAFPRYNY